MVSTVTTAVRAAVAADDTGVLGALAVAALIFLLVERETAAAAGPRWQPLARCAAVAAAPLLIVLAAIVCNRVLTPS
jgi:hypothetical protein